jgi:prolyl-tRNA synthetase
LARVSREKWRKQFGEWFREVLISAEIMDYRYPIKGFGVWLPYGFQIRRNVFQIIRNLLDATGHKEALFPLLIPETSLEKEAEHVRGFEDQCFWVTQGGQKPLKVKYALRPTSETILGPMLHLWIRAHTDLPLKLYQIVTVFRYETKATRPILRMREFDFKEAHTSHATAEEAEAEVKEEIENYKKFFDELCVAYRISRRPDWDKFAGAVYTIAFDMLCPDGRTLQIGTVHNLGQNFSKAFDVTYEKPDGTHEYVWQTCAGISGRGIASVLITHGDDHGIVLPPEIAPTQIIVIPIPYKEKSETVNQKALEIAQKLKEAGFRAEADTREDLTPGAKYYHWELRGIPLRIEIGPRDVEKNEVTIVRRDTLERETCKIEDIENKLRLTMEKMTMEMRQKAWEWLEKRTYRTGNLEEAKQLIKERAGIIEVPWCGSPKCGQELEEIIDARILGTPEEETSQEIGDKCILCQKTAETTIRIALTY